MKTRFRTIEDLLSGDEPAPPLPLEVVPNYMGINLVSVEAFSWTEQDDGQLVSLTIDFRPKIVG